MPPPRHILPVIVLAQFCCTSLWFASNAVMEELAAAFQLAPSALGHLTSAVQFGFLAGTLLFAILAVADRFSPSRVFMVCGLLAAAANLGALLPGNTLGGLLAFRFLVGFCLAGIYPVGMKIAADYYATGLGRSLGYLVGALVLGTAFPHLLGSLSVNLDWQKVLLATSLLAVFGGLVLWLLVPDGPLRKANARPDLSAFFAVFRGPDFRGAAFGYFGHMWELYAFWTFVPLLLEQFGGPDLNISWWAFLVLGTGAWGCVLGGYWSRWIGPGRVALYALLGSGLCCLISPWVFGWVSPLILGFLLLWGLLVTMDSPQFSTLVATHAPPENKGTALTIVNCLGFGLTVVSIQLLGYLAERLDAVWLLLPLVPGPFLGLLSVWRRPQLLVN
ncbi:MAG: MFS transporter [Bacteroidota bacterium]